MTNSGVCILTVGLHPSSWWLKSCLQRITQKKKWEWNFEKLFLLPKAEQLCPPAFPLGTRPQSCLAKQGLNLHLGTWLS